MASMILNKIDLDMDISEAEFGQESERRLDRGEGLAKTMLYRGYWFNRDKMKFEKKH